MLKYRCKPVCNYFSDFFNTTIRKIFPFLGKSVYDIYYITYFLLVNTIQMCIFCRKQKTFSMNTIKHILIIDSASLEQQYLISLFKRSMCLNGWSLTFTLVSTFGEANKKLHADQYDIVILDDLVGFEHGYDLVPLIHESQKHAPVIIMISNDRTLLARGLHAGVHHTLIKNDIIGKMRITHEYVLVPIP